MKPHVICHMLSPLDGRLLVESWAPLGSDQNKAVIDEYERLHDTFAADAWMSGTTTMEEFATGRASPRTSAIAPARPWHIADKSARHFAIAIDRNGRLHWDSPVADRGHVVVVLASSVSDEHLNELIDCGVSYFVVPDVEIDLSFMLNELGRRLGIKKILLEGGARMNGTFLREGLVDEVSLLLCPAIDGASGKPAIFEAGEGLGTELQVEMISATPVGAGACHLRYRISKR
mgnify:CR=1 FL=1